jgi:hypothetical protein
MQPYMGASPSLSVAGIANGDTAPYSMSELRNMSLTNGLTPSTGPISLSTFKGQFAYPGPYGTRHTASNEGAGDRFGQEVAISEDSNYIVVTAQYEDTKGTDAGSFYVFTRNWGDTWTQQAHLYGSDTVANDRMGLDIDIDYDGNTVIVGSNANDSLGNLSGCAHIFVRSGTTWSQQAKLTDPNGYSSNDQFGWSVAISSDGLVAAVGVKDDNTNGYTDNGSIAIFRRTVAFFNNQPVYTWNSEGWLIASQPRNYYRLGYSTAIGGFSKTIVAGSNQDSYSAQDSGAVYVYEYNQGSWYTLAKLKASDPEYRDYFGSDVDINYAENTIVVGAYYEDAAGNASGSAYVFKRSGSAYYQTQKLVPTNLRADDHLGLTVNMSANAEYIILSAEDSDITPLTNVGRAFVYKLVNNDLYVEHLELLSSNPQAGARFGRGVDISYTGQYAVVSAHYENGVGASSGAMYTYKLF